MGCSKIAIITAKTTGTMILCPMDIIVKKAKRPTRIMVAFR